MPTEKQAEKRQQSVTASGIDRLVQLCHETGYLMPKGMTRQQRREWAQNIEKTKKDN